MSDKESKLSLLNRQLIEDEMFNKKYRSIVLTEESGVVSESIQKSMQKLTDAIGRYDFRFSGLMNKWTLEYIVEIKKQTRENNIQFDAEEKRQKERDAKLLAKKEELQQKNSLNSLF